ncbi:MAG: helix-turn-helix domain-containing protein [Alphaproteobacteria bacterium]|nr:helix-turn-helix domain-containing protein [Alphaproteobacteria bacterium]MCB9693855.1 helix-turn-helix domain-containing protein [Alphaproteobacteria bacterium]
MAAKRKRGRPKVEVTLVGDEQAELERLTRRKRTNRNLALRAQLVLDSASGMADTAVAAKNHVNPKTVATWRQRFAELRLEGLFDEPLPCAERKITDEDVERIVVENTEGAHALEHAAHGQEGGHQSLLRGPYLAGSRLEAPHRPGVQAVH